ncbi:MAG TPA: serine/threonine-protein kinase [Thermoanaerobaculia bacterium]|nr:serine/threonine-protein kinase [Thermoanaerobaculia bacterium]
MSERVDNIPKVSRLGRFEILSELGKGAMGVVYLAKDPSIGRLVAIKTIRAQSGDDDDSESREFRERFMREAQTAGILSHPNIVTIYDVGEDKESGVSFIAMEYIEGKTIKALLVDRTNFAPDQISDIIGQVAEALDYAHRKGIIHRDIKPANIMITTDGKVKITDFGIAKVASSNLTSTGQFLGTPNYMSPEQVTGAPVDGRSDIFSLGVVLYEMLSRRKPFAGENLTTISYKIVHENYAPLTDAPKNVPEEFDPILSKALAKDPWNRFQRGKDFALSLYQAKARFEEQAIFQDLGTMVSSAENLPTLKLEHLEDVARQGDASAASRSGAGRPDHDETHPSSPRVPIEGAPAAAPAREREETEEPVEAGDSREAEAAPEPAAVGMETAPVASAVGESSMWRRSVNPKYWWGIVGFLVLAVAAVVIVLRIRAPKVETKASEAASRAQIEIEQQFASGRALYQKGRYAESLAIFRAVLQKDPAMKAAREYSQMAEEGLRNEESKKAQQEKAALVATHLENGRAALDKKNYESAIAEAEAALNVDAGNADAQKLSEDARRQLADSKKAELKKAEKRKAETLARAGQAQSKPASSSGTATAAPKPAAGPPTLRLTFASPIPRGYVMVAVNDKIIYRKNFDFGKKDGGMVSDTIVVTPGAVTVKVWLTTPDPTIKGYLPMNATFAGGESRALTLTLQGKKFSAKIS